MSLKSYVQRAISAYFTKRGREHDGDRPRRLRRRQLGILWEITILLVVVFIAFGLVTYFVFRASENRLIDKSIDKLKQTEAENISSSYTYVMNLLTPGTGAEGD